MSDLDSVLLAGLVGPTALKSIRFGIHALRRTGRARASRDWIQRVVELHRRKPISHRLVVTISLRARSVIRGGVYETNDRRALLVAGLARERLLHARAPHRAGRLAH